MPEQPTAEEKAKADEQAALDKLNKGIDEEFQKLEAAPKSLVKAEFVPEQTPTADEPDDKAPEKAEEPSPSDDADKEKETKEPEKAEGDEPEGEDQDKQPSASLEEQESVAKGEQDEKKGTAEYRIKQLVERGKQKDAKITELEERLTQLEASRAKEPAKPETMPDEPEAPKLAVLKPEEAEKFTNAQLMNGYNEAKSDGDEELARRYLTAMDDKERYERFKGERSRVEERQRKVGELRAESVNRTRKEYPDIYKAGTPLADEYNRLMADPEIVEAIGIISKLPNAPHIVARMTQASLDARSSSKDALGKRIKELEDENARLRKGKFPPKSGASADVSPPKRRSEKDLSPEDKFDAAIERVKQGGRGIYQMS